MTVSLSQLRAAVATQVQAVSGFSEVSFPVEYFGRAQNTIAHKGFSVSVQRSTAEGDRQRRSEGMYSLTSVTVVFGYRMRPHDIYPVDYDNALDAEESIIKQIMTSYYSIRAGTQIMYSSSNRRFSDSLEWMIIEIEFTAYHHIGA